VARQDRGPKILVFKRRQKKAYKKMRGHRQDLTDLTIKTISFN
jgi:large subunit ribosomal protein L21